MLKKTAKYAIISKKGEEAMILFGSKKNFYKANMHCHTTLSDGKKTPAEIKEAYKAEGYSVVAFTDHEHVIAHPELCDEDFIAITGCEHAVKEFPTVSTGTNLYMKVAHFNFYAKELDNVLTPCYSSVADHYVTAENEGLIKADGDEVRIYSPEYINAMIKKAHDMGFLVAYNHPGWSLETAFDYMAYEGLDFVEIYNNGSELAGYPDDERVFFDMLLGGKRLYCTAADDNHNSRGIDPKGSDSFGGFIMINADKLDYAHIISALENGDFYASTGARITSIKREGRTVTVSAPNAKKITVSSAKRFFKSVKQDGDGPLTSATFTLPDEKCGFRITVRATDGSRAFSQYYEV